MKTEGLEGSPDGGLGTLRIRLLIFPEKVPKSYPQSGNHSVAKKLVALNHEDR